MKEAWGLPSGKYFSQSGCSGSNSLGSCTYCTVIRAPVPEPDRLNRHIGKEARGIPRLGLYFEKDRIPSRIQGEVLGAPLPGRRPRNTAKRYEQRSTPGQHPHFFSHVLSYDSCFGLRSPYHHDGSFQTLSRDTRLTQPAPCKAPNKISKTNRLPGFLGHATRLRGPLFLRQIPIALHTQSPPDSRGCSHNHSPRAT